MKTSTARHSRCNALLGSTLLFALCATPRAAHAAAELEIPAECGSLSSFEAELRERLGPSASLDTTRVLLTPDLSGYRLFVEVGSERRELYDPSCQELMHAAVVITLALLEPQVPPTEAVSEAPVVLLAAPRHVIENAPRTTHFALAAGGGVHFGTVPNPTLLIELAAELDWARWGATGGFRYLVPSSELDATNHGARVSGVGAYLAGTVELWPRVQGRLGMVGYRLSGSGLGSVEHRADSAWELGPIGGASFTPFLRPPFWTNVVAEAQLNLLRAHFDISHYGTVFTVPWLSGSLFLRAGVVF